MTRYEKDWTGEIFWIYSLTMSYGRICVTLRKTTGSGISRFKSNRKSRFFKRGPISEYLKANKRSVRELNEELEELHYRDLLEENRANHEIAI